MSSCAYKRTIILDGSNYFTWKKFVSVQCQRKEVKKLLTQTTDKESKEEGEAQAIIMESLSSDDQYLVATCDSAKEMMGKLELKYKHTI